MPWQLILDLWSNGLQGLSEEEGKEKQTQIQLWMHSVELYFLLKNTIFLQMQLTTQVVQLPIHSTLAGIPVQKDVEG